MKNEVVRRLGRLILWCAGVATLLSVIGAYNSDQFGWPLVWFYWFGLLAVGAVIGTFIFRTVTDEWLHGRPWLVRWVAGSTALSVPMIGIVSVAQTMVGEPIPARALPIFAAQVSLIVFAVSAIQLTLDGVDKAKREAAAARSALAEAPAQATAPATTPAPSPAPDAPAPPLDVAPSTSPPSFARRLPPKLMGAEIWALSAEDHYVRVHSSKGADLVLIRLADAISEMDGADGVQTHRSWWVAKAGVQAARKRTEGGMITLRSGVEAPISRGFMAGVIAKGWL